MKKGKLMAKIKMPAILGWLIAGMLLGPHAAGLMPQQVLDTEWYKTIIMWMQCAFGVMLGVELIWKKLKSYGKALVVTTLMQSLGTFAVVSLAFGLIFAFLDVPVYLAFVFGGIALATAPGIEGEEINIATNSEISMADTLKLIAEIMECDVQWVTDPERLRPGKSEVFRLWGDNTKITSLTSWRPAYTIEQGLRETVEWFSNKDNLAKYKSGIYNQ